MMALGLIETRGMLAAVEGADAMLKAAEVRLLERILATGGLVTVTVAGEVAAVQAAVDAAAGAIRRIEGATLVSSHVIPRPDQELASILTLLPDSDENRACDAPVPPPARSGSAGAAPRPERKGQRPAPLSASRLKAMGMPRLRQLALELEGMTLSADEVAGSDKKSLIAAILRVYRQTEE